MAEKSIPQWLKGTCRYVKTAGRQRLRCGPTLRPQGARGGWRAWALLDEASAYQVLATANSHGGRQRLAYRQLRRSYRLLGDALAKGAGVPEFERQALEVGQDIESEAQGQGLKRGSADLDRSVRFRSRGQKR